MATSARHPLDKLPRLPSEGIPSTKEADALTHLHEACRLMMQQVGQFEAAISLFEFCTAGIEAQKRTGRPSGLPLTAWRLMAGRDAGMSVYHFGMSIKTVGKFAGKYPWLENAIDLSVVKEAKKLMNDTFPGWQRTRHALAHRAEFFVDPSESRQHSIKLGGGRTQTYWNRLQGREFSHSLNDKHSAVELSQATLDKLTDVRRKFFSAFKSP